MGRISTREAATTMWLPTGRSLMVKPGWLNTGRDAPPHVVLNWFEELERQVPRDN
jgi:hypothetical protein